LNGRKRHLAVDKLGLPLAISVSAADVHDSMGGYGRSKRTASG